MFPLLICSFSCRIIFQNVNIQMLLLPEYATQTWAGGNTPSRRSFLYTNLHDNCKYKNCSRFLIVLSSLNEVYYKALMLMTMSMHLVMMMMMSMVWGWWLAGCFQFLIATLVSNRLAFLHYLHYERSKLYGFKNFYRRLMIVKLQNRHCHHRRQHFRPLYSFKFWLPSASG